MPRITISYRREDSGVITGRIFDRLVVNYGRASVFRDIDSIPPGVDFREHINEVLTQSDNAGARRAMLDGGEGEAEPPQRRG